MEQQTAVYAQNGEPISLLQPIGGVVSQELSEVARALSSTQQQAAILKLGSPKLVTASKDGMYRMASSAQTENGQEYILAASAQSVEDAALRVSAAKLTIQGLKL